MSINITNETRPFEINSNIVEWDMRRAGLHIIKEFNLLSTEEIQYFESLPKKESDIAIGKRQIGDKEFSKRLEQGFTDIMNFFLKQNNLDIDLDVISIKKDEIIDTHTAEADAAVYVLDGEIEIHFDAQKFEVNKGELLMFKKDEQHKVVAKKDSKFFLIKI